MSVSIILPTYNELGNIEKLIPDLEQTFQGFPMNIIVVDDLSSDGTTEKVRQLQAIHPNIRLICRQERHGGISAIRAGFDQATSEILLSADADLAYTPHDIFRVYEAAAQGTDLVLGSRHIPGGHYVTPDVLLWLKYGISVLGNVFLRLTTGIKIADFTSDLRAIRRDVWQAIVVTEDTKALLLETILRVSDRRGTIREIPVTFRDRPVYGHSKFNMLVELPKFANAMLRHLTRHWLARLHRPSRGACSRNRR